MSPKPSLVILDLNLPIMDGREVLAEMKNHPTIGLMPVVILTTSSEENDILYCYRHHANTYITKPHSYNEFIDFIEQIKKFWLSIATLPDEIRVN